MKRRSAIKNLLIIAGGIAILPACSTENGKASIQLSNLSINGDQEALLAEIAEAIIPAGDTQGAKDLNLHLFVLKMVDDCHPEEEQKQFLKGLDQFNDLSNQKFSKTFMKADIKERQELLATLDATQPHSQDVEAFYKITKRRVIQGFLNSKYVMTDLKQYELIPGRYNGYFPVN
ncbi:gluconate 2-dehydrogenase subunit 3 family protein [Olivibacter sp. SDN3]|uniref:gluconate 2-dehydrogenase subunit 3 family protein n=1 Tax=Olivibacter sp. SDN3 TaxID=2764720 RepID=UPI0016517A41|nr:gluconate 2-dehydrogenase subunit 3 family protein [Olivibacter sp. SDN3]QNL49010.1 gluconate 2-dehydrogenase subunit 3 family protein [Olivibacter sp. SDN3]